MRGDFRGKVIVIGLDGATFDILDPLMQMGKMPNLARIIRHGSRAKLRSTMPPVTGPSWVSFMTGKRPENHGVFDFVKPAPNQIKRQIISYNHIRSRTLWSILSEHRRQIGVLNVPVTYPPPEVNGFVISGMLSPNVEQSFAYPPELYHELKQNVPGYVLDVWWQKYGQGSVKRFLRELISCTEQRERALFYLLRHKPWDFFMAVFVGTDRIQHFLWAQIMAALSPKLPADQPEISRLIIRYYQQLDGIIGRLLQIMDRDTTLIIMSDHGFGPLKKKFNINSWLARQGLLKYDRLGFQGLRRRAKLRYTLQQITMAVDFLELRKKLPARHRKFNKRAEGHNFLDYIHWGKTRAYAASNTEQGLYLNLKGREPQGIVSPGEEYENLREEIINRLESLRDPDTGELLVTRIYKREEIYQGEFTHEAPDIVFFLKDGEYLADVQPVDGLFQAANWRTGTGTHRMDGILAAYGRGIKAQGQLEEAGIVDLAPTILSLMDLPIPADMDGRVLSRLFDPEFLAGHPPEYASAGEIDTAVPVGGVGVYSEREAFQIEGRLRSLGYLD